MLINAAPLIDQLGHVDVAHQHLLQQIQAAEDKAATTPVDEHRELMNRIAQARNDYLQALVALSYRLRMEVEKS